MHEIQDVQHHPRPIEGAPPVTDHTALILLAAAITMLTATLIALAAGYLARRDHATWPQTITHAATAYAATLTLAAALGTSMQALMH
jgi:hypothetical protein